MSEPTGSIAFPLPPAPEHASAGIAPRIGAFAAAAVVLLAGGVISFGAVLLAPFGMWLFAVVQRKRGKRQSRVAGWLAASATVMVAIAAMGALLAAYLPPGSAGKIKAASDSATAASAARPKPPVPAWLERIAPGATASAAQSPTSAWASSPVFGAFMMVWGGAMALVMVATFYGTIGWVGGMLAGFALRGRWPARSEALVAELV